MTIFTSFLQQIYWVMLNVEASISVMDCVRIYDDLLSFDSEKISKKILEKAENAFMQLCVFKGRVL